MEADDDAAELEPLDKHLRRMEEQSSCGCNSLAQSVHIAGNCSTGNFILIYVDSHSFPMIEYQCLPLNAFQDISTTKCPLTFDEDETVETLPSLLHQWDTEKKVHSVQAERSTQIRKRCIRWAELNTVLPFSPAALPSCISQYRLDLNIFFDPLTAQQRVESTFSTLKFIKHPPLEQDVTVACWWQRKKRPSWRDPGLWQSLFFSFLLIWIHTRLLCISFFMI